MVHLGRSVRSKSQAQSSIRKEQLYYYTHDFSSSEISPTFFLHFSKPVAIVIDPSAN